MRIFNNFCQQGKLAYVSQQAWIQNRTVKDNITFGKPMDDIKYKHVVEACQLKTDFDLLPAGDETEIGEKVNCKLCNNIIFWKWLFGATRAYRKYQL